MYENLGLLQAVGLDIGVIGTSPDHAPCLTTRE